MKPKALVLFSGAGGASLGIEQAGFDIVMAVDSNFKGVPCCESHKANFPNCETVKADLETFDSFPRGIDLAWFSAPCKLLSYANTFSHNVKEGMKLVNRSVEIIKEVKPRFWVIENVPGDIEKELKLPYYELDAADFGVPQNRRRVFFTNVPRPNPSHSRHGNHTLDGNHLKKWISVAESLNLESDVLQHPNCSDGTKRTVELPSYTIRTRQNNGLLFWRYANECYSEPRTRELDEPAPTINTMNRGGSLSILLNRPSRTVTASEGEFGKTSTRFAGSLIGRKLTPEECAKLQGFPDSFIFKGNKSQRYEQIGNAVPPALARAICEEAARA